MPYWGPGGAVLRNCHIPAKSHLQPDRNAPGKTIAGALALRSPDSVRVERLTPSATASNSLVLSSASTIWTEQPAAVFSSAAVLVPLVPARGEAIASPPRSALASACCPVPEEQDANWAFAHGKARPSQASSSFAQKNRDVMNR